MSNNSGVNVSSTPNTSGTGTTNGTSNTNVMSAANGDLVNTANGNVIADNSNESSTSNSENNVSKSPNAPTPNSSPQTTDEEERKTRLRWIAIGGIVLTVVLGFVYIFSKTETTGIDPNTGLDYTERTAGTFTNILAIFIVIVAIASSVSLISALTM